MDTPTRSSAPLVRLVLVNLATLAGVVFFGWGAYAILFSYWAENVVIGLYCSLCIVFARGGEVGEGENPTLTNLLCVPVFLVPYALVAALHCMGIVLLFGPGNVFQDLGTESFGQAFRESLTRPILENIAVMFAAHGCVFMRDYLRGGGNLSATPTSVTRGTYRRVMVMSLSIFACGFLFAILPRLFSVLLVALKTGLDFYLTDDPPPVV